MTRIRRGTKAKHDDDSVSLNKYISDSGFCSRREADTYIEQERVSLNGQEAKKGNRVHPGDVVEIDGEPLRKKGKTIYIAFHKPIGITSTTDTSDKTNIISYINYPHRIFPIGRLDKDSEGLIFLTNDGNIVNKILRAGNKHEKEYLVTVDKPLSTDFIRQMGAGVSILGKKTLPCKVSQESKYTFRITLIQGLNRQIRRMSEVLGYRVMKLVRHRIMHITLQKLPVGHWRYLTAEEVQTMNAMTVAAMLTPEIKNTLRTPTRTPKPVQPKAIPADTPQQKRTPERKTSYKAFRSRGTKK